MNYMGTTTTATMRLSEHCIITATNHSNSTSSASTWQQLMVGAGSAAGSTAAVVSEESMKCLRYCLSWLQYAIRHLGQQMGLIRNFLVSLATSPQQQKQQPQILAFIKNDMVTTLRKVIDIITCYASNALPYQAKATVRGAILSLPSRWASLNDDTSTATTTGTTTTTTNTVTHRQTKGQEEVALRLLAFGQESTEMLTSIHTIFDDTVQRAESWLERLRILNPMSSNSSSNNNNNIQLLPQPNCNSGAAVDAAVNNVNENDDDDFYNVLLPPIRNLHISSSTSTTTNQNGIPSS